MKKILTFIVVTIISWGFLMAPAPVFAECPEGTIPVSILGDNANVEVTEEGERCLKDDGKGSSIFSILNLVVTIMSVGVGILGVIGITIVGIQYLTAGGNEEKTRKAKRRMFEIIIGLVAYVLLYAAVTWLMGSNS